MTVEPQKLAIVSGTSSGIGAGLAQALLESDWQVIGLARRDVEFDSPNYIHIKADLADLAALDTVLLPALVHHVSQTRCGRVALVNNAAAIGTLKGLDDISAAELSKVYMVNVVAAGVLMGLVAKHVPLTSWLKIVNVSSGAAHRGLPGLADYAGSKAALRLTGMTLAAEFEQLKRSRASILSYEPGIVDTEMQTKARAPSEGFPSLDMFQGFHSSGSLQPVEAVIGEMLDFLVDSESPAFSEKRFSPS